MYRLLVINLAAAVTAPVIADDNSCSIIDPEKVTDDYHIQGEYVGMLRRIPPGFRRQKYGLQVIALGNDEFAGVACPGGLPGDGYIGCDKIRARGKTEDGVTRLIAPGVGSVLILKGSVEVFTDEGFPAGTMYRIERKSQTLGQKPPDEAIVLFDGTSATNFEGGQMVLIDLLLAGCESRQKFGDHSVHLEFRTPYQPLDRGQARGNSGVYVQGRYEIQVLDSFGLEGESNECGGIYSIAKPKVNACFSPLTWQTYDIDFKAARYENGKKLDNARITVRHNGIVIHKDIEIPAGTPGRYPEGEGPGPLYLQGHGNQVAYRNIWVVEQ